MKYAEYMQEIKYLKIPLENFKKTLNDHPIKMWAYCVHDKDEYDEDDEKLDPKHKAGTLKPVHVHIMMKLQSDQVPENIAKWFQDEPQYIQKGKSKNSKYMYENMCSYLVHETPTSDGKYHYPDDEVIANFDFHEFMEKVRKGVEEAKNKRTEFDETLVKITSGEIKRYNIDDYIDDITQIRRKREIDEAFRIRERRMQLEKIDRQMNVIYMFGPSGTGKTTFAKVMAREMGFGVPFISGSSNDSLEGYLGQRCVIFDDLRPTDWKISDLLKLLDNNTSSLVRSRYYNKIMSECELIIITNVLSIEDFFDQLKENEAEPIEQLKRRCRVMMEFKQSYINTFEYNDMIKDYENRGQIANPVALVRFAQETNMLENINNFVQKWSEEEIQKNEGK